jgi:hypothetical protein
MKNHEEDLTELIELAKMTVEKAEANAMENPTSEFIQVVVVEPFKKPFKKVIKNELDAMKEIVGGWIENVTIGETEKGARIVIVVNEEGKLIGLPMNRRIVNFDILVGNFFIAAYNLEGDMVSLSDDECEHFIKRFTPIEIYI